MRLYFAMVVGVFALAGCQQEEIPILAPNYQSVTIPDGTVTVDGEEFVRKSRPELDGSKTYFVVVEGRTFRCKDADCVEAVARGLRAQENDDDGDDY